MRRKTKAKELPNNRRIFVRLRDDVVIVEVHCADQYFARVYYEDIVDQLAKDKSVYLKFTVK
jgi:hypothetical protein